jgi:hypothetical protein
MDGTRILDPVQLETLLRRALMVRAPTSLRSEGSNRLLGDLQLRGLEPGHALHLVGAKRRDQLPPAGTAILLSLLLGEEVLAIHTTLLDPLVAHEEEAFFPPVLRAAWPTEGVSFHHRADVRVAAPDQTPLDAVLRIPGAEFPARVLNLTETGVGVGLVEDPGLHLGMEVAVETSLPDGGLLRLAGDLRHIELLEWDPLPWRAGIVLRGNPQDVLEGLRAFVQNRRTDRSDSLRQGAP